MQPAAHVITGRAAAANNFVMAPASAKIASPAPTTRFLVVDVPFTQPCDPAGPVDACFQRTHCPRPIADKSVACRQVSLC